MLEGAREAKLPLAYIRLIEKVAAVEDSDTKRASRELVIYS